MSLNNEKKGKNKKKKFICPKEFEVLNGLIGLKRDVWCCLIGIIDDDEKVRNMVGISHQTFEWAHHKNFYFIRKYIPALLHNPCRPLYTIQPDGLSVKFVPSNLPSREGGHGNHDRLFVFDRVITTGVWQLTVAFSQLGCTASVGVVSAKHIKWKSCLGDTYGSWGYEIGQNSMLRFCCEEIDLDEEWDVKEKGVVSVELNMGNGGKTRIKLPYLEKVNPKCDALLNDIFFFKEGQQLSNSIHFNSKVSLVYPPLLTLSGACVSTFGPKEWLSSEMDKFKMGVHLAYSLDSGVESRFVSMTRLSHPTAKIPQGQEQAVTDVDDNSESENWPEEEDYEVVSGVGDFSSDGSNVSDDDEN